MIRRSRPCRAAAAPTPSVAEASIDLLEPPERHVRRQVRRAIRFRPDHLPQPLQRLPADGDVVVFAAGVADRVPHLVEVVGFLQGRPQALAAVLLQCLAGVEVPAIGPVEGEQLVDGVAVRESLSVGTASGRPSAPDSGGEAGRCRSPSLRAGPSRSGLRAGRGFPIRRPATEWPPGWPANLPASGGGSGTSGGVVSRAAASAKLQAVMGASPFLAWTDPGGATPSWRRGTPHRRRGSRPSTENPVAEPGAEPNCSPHDTGGWAKVASRRLKTGPSQSGEVRRGVMPRVSHPCDRSTPRFTVSQSTVPIPSVVSVETVGPLPVCASVEASARRVWQS